MFTIELKKQCYTLNYQMKIIKTSLFYLSFILAGFVVGITIFYITLHGHWKSDTSLYFDYEKELIITIKNNYGKVIKVVKFKDDSLDAVK